MINRQFGALSGVAIALVVLNHAIELGRLAPVALGLPAATGAGAALLTVLQQLGIVFAVPAFFFISGCFATYAGQGDNLRHTYKTALSRLKSIVLPYVVWSVVFYLLLVTQQLAGYPFPWVKSYSLLEYVKHLLVGYPFHFVPLLVFWYVLSPLLVRFGRRYGAVILAAIAVYQLVLINLEYPAMFGIRLPEFMRVLAPPVLGRPLADWAIFFPLGLVYSLYAKSAAASLQKVKWVLLAATVILFATVCLHEIGVIRFPLARILCMLPLVGLLPLIQRNKIPLVETFEWIGKRSYGFYLTHLVAINVAIMLLMAVAPGLLGVQVILHPLLLAVGLGVPALLMSGAAKLPIRAAYRYVFG